MINLGLPTHDRRPCCRRTSTSARTPTACPASASSEAIVGASMTVGLILAVLALIVSAIVWALGANSSNPHLAGRGKFGVLVGLGAAIITGASVALVNFFWNVGQSV